MMIKNQRRGPAFGMQIVYAVAVPLIAAALALVLGGFHVAFGPMIVSLLLGVLLANTTFGSASMVTDCARTAKFYLRLGVGLLGFRISGEALHALGVRGMFVAFTTVLVVLLVTLWAGKLLGVRRGLTYMIASGFAICGAAAIAAVEGAIKRRDEDVGIAIAMVTIFGGLMIIALPLMSSLLGLNEYEAGVWAGASIHEVAQVVAAASILGSSAITVAATVKLGRVLVLGPVYSLISVINGRGEARMSGGERRSAPIAPWFVVMFIVAAVVRLTGWIPPGIFDVIDFAATFLLAAGMFGLGLGIRVRELLPIDFRAVALSVVSTAVAAIFSLGLVLLLY